MNCNDAFRRRYSEVKRKKKKAVLRKLKNFIPPSENFFLLNER